MALVDGGSGDSGGDGRPQGDRGVGRRPLHQLGELLASAVMAVAFAGPTGMRKRGGQAPGRLSELSGRQESRINHKILLVSGADWGRESRFKPRHRATHWT